MRVTAYGSKSEYQLWLGECHGLSADQEGVCIELLTRRSRRDQCDVFPTLPEQFRLLSLRDGAVFSPPRPCGGRGGAGWLPRSVRLPIARSAAVSSARRPPGGTSYAAIFGRPSRSRTSDGAHW